MYVYTTLPVLYPPSPLSFALAWSGRGPLTLRISAASGTAENFLVNEAGNRNTFHMARPFPNAASANECLLTVALFLSCSVRAHGRCGRGQHGAVCNPSGVGKK